MTVKRSVLIDNLANRVGKGQTGKGQTGLRHTLAAAARNPHLDLAACKIVFAYTGIQAVSQDAGYAVACGWAVFHGHYTGPVNAPGVNLGKALSRLPESDGERLFTALSLATAASLREHLVTTCAALGAARAIPDWHLLHRDVYFFLAFEPREVLRRWATGLYHQPPTSSVTQEEEVPV